MTCWYEWNSPEYPDYINISCEVANEKLKPLTSLLTAPSCVIYVEFLVSFMNMSLNAQAYAIVSASHHDTPNKTAVKLFKPAKNKRSSSPSMNLVS